MVNKKLIRRWDSERELFTTTSYTYYSTTAHNKLYSLADDRLHQRVISHLLYAIYAVYANCLPPKFRYSIVRNALVLGNLREYRNK